MCFVCVCVCLLLLVWGGVIGKETTERFSLLFCLVNKNTPLAYHLYVHPGLGLQAHIYVHMCRASSCVFVQCVHSGGAGVVDPKSVSDVWLLRKNGTTTHQRWPLKRTHATFFCLVKLLRCTCQNAHGYLGICTCFAVK